MLTDTVKFEKPFSRNLNFTKMHAKAKKEKLNSKEHRYFLSPSRQLEFLKLKGQLPVKIGAKSAVHSVGLLYI